MPFGIRSPSKIIEKYSDTIISKNTDKCHCCDDVTPYSDAHKVFAVAIVTFRKLRNDDVMLQHALLCPKCYRAQSRLKFETLDDLKQHIVFGLKIDRKPFEQKAVVVKSTLASATHELPSREFLLDLYNRLGVYLGLTPSTEPVSQDDDDDLLLGMTDEQRARMDAAVKTASDRTKEIPREDWNFL